ncbi:nuclear transport factor 2 family protein [Ruicaihuangia caeni]|uniref:nuclear transport factor 2 family protein n=1 Tax=Ruicaihuangia caeni TaxID=3042517 RepID=UPI00338F0536
MEEIARAIAELRAVEDIKRLKARYFRLIDTKQWEKLRSCFTADCTFEGLWAGGDGADAFITSIRTNLAEVPTVHAGYMPEIEVLDESTARGIWSMTDYLEWEPDALAYRGVSVPGQRGIRGYGHYSEEYTLTESGWRISHLRMTRLRIDPLVGEREPVHTNFMPPVRDEWLPGDRWLDELA